MVWVSIASGTSLGVILGHISSRSWVGGFLTLVDRQVAADATLVLVGTSPVDGFCGCCGVCTTDFLGVCSVVAGATRYGGVVALATGAVTGVAGAGLTGGIPGEHSGVAGATSVMVDLLGLTASG